MDPQLKGSLVQIAALLIALEVRRFVSSWWGKRNGNGHPVSVAPKTGNGFDREDHGLLMVIASRLDRMDERMLKVDSMEREVARLASGLEWSNTHPRP